VLLCGSELHDICRMPCHRLISPLESAHPLSAQHRWRLWVEFIKLVENIFEGRATCCFCAGDVFLRWAPTGSVPWLCGQASRQRLAVARFRSGGPLSPAALACFGKPVECFPGSAAPFNIDALLYQGRGSRFELRTRTLNSLGALWLRPLFRRRQKPISCCAVSAAARTLSPSTASAARSTAAACH